MAVIKIFIILDHYQLMNFKQKMLNKKILEKILKINFNKYNYL